MVFARRPLPLVMLVMLVMPAAALGLSGLQAPAAEKPAGKEAGKGVEKGGDKAAEKSADTSEAKRPACMHCGATCGLEAVCVCRPGTKKIPQTEYEAKCDPLCVPRCGGPPWPWGRKGPAGGCNGCEAECHDAWVRQRKKLVVEKKDEEQPTIERHVAWVCRACAPRAPVGCTGDAAAPRRPGCWPTWLPHR